MNALNLDKNTEDFLSNYNDEVIHHALKLRSILFSKLPGIIEQVDISAKMIAYCYGQKYAELICVLIPSKKGLKLGFNRGVDLPDPEGLLKGTGKISRYIEIKSEDQITSMAVKTMIGEALQLYKQLLQQKK